MPLSPFSIDDIPPARRLNTALDNTYTVAFVFTDAIINNAGLGNGTGIPDLTIPVPASAWFAFDAHIMFDSNTIADLAMRFPGPFNTFWGLANWGPPLSATSTTNQLELAMSTGTTTRDVSYGGAGSGTPISARPAGYVVTSTTPGTISVSFWQNTADPSNTIIKQGSWVSLSRVF